VELLQNLEACLYAYIDAAGIRAETKMPSSALPQAGPVRSSERQEPHRTPGAWSQALRPHRRRTQARRGRTDQDLARFPHWREEHAPYPADHHRQTARPLGDPRRRWVRDSVRPRLPGVTHPATLCSSRRPPHQRLRACRNGFSGSSVARENSVMHDRNRMRCRARPPIPRPLRVTGICKRLPNMAA